MAAAVLIAAVAHPKWRNVGELTLVPIILVLLVGGTTCTLHGAPGPR